MAANGINASSLLFDADSTEDSAETFETAEYSAEDAAEDSTEAAPICDLGVVKFEQSEDDKQCATSSFNNLDANNLNASFPTTFGVYPDMPSTSEEIPYIPKIYNCTINKCTLIFSSPFDLAAHVKEHKKQLTLADLPPKREQQNIAHRVLDANGILYYKCPFEGCDKKYTKSYSFTKHHRVHTGVKPYVCNVCNKGFTKKDYLDSHTRTHTGQRPYECDQCEYKAKQKMCLNKHKERHHPSSYLVGTIPDEDQLEDQAFDNEFDEEMAKDAAHLLKYI